MPGELASTLSFQVLSASGKRIRLRCVGGCELAGTVCAYVLGIPIGEAPIRRKYAVGEILEIAATYFPQVSLPTEVRFACGDVELAPALPISSADDVMALLGYGDILVRDLELEGGLLRGALINKINGVFPPNLYVLLNKKVTRTAVLEPARALDDGGTICLFAIPIRSADFSASGLHVSLHIPGIEYPIASLSFVAKKQSPVREQLLAIDSKVSNLQRSASLQIESINKSLQRRLDIQQARLDAFVEYAINVLMNALGSSDAKAAIEMVYALKTVDRLDQPREPPAESPSRHPEDAISVPVDSSDLTFGWYNLEKNERGAFRWMAQAGLIRNPSPSRNVRKIELYVDQVYGAHEPMLHAAIDDHALTVSIARKESGFLVLMKPQQPCMGTSLHLESFAVGCPASDNGAADRRVLSLAVTRAGFYYC